MQRSHYLRLPRGLRADAVEDVAFIVRQSKSQKAKNEPEPERFDAFLSYASADRSKVRRTGGGGGWSGLSRLDRCIIAWLVVDALTHLLLEASFCLLHLEGPIKDSKSLWAVSKRHWVSSP